MNLNLLTLLVGDSNRLRYIGRHSTSLVLHKENVAEHSYYVALYAEFICEWVERNNTTLPIDRLEVLRRCLFHDLDEARTGDFQRPFKHSDPDLKQMLDEAAGLEFSKIVKAITDCKGYHDKCLELWESSKDDTNEGRIVALADYLSVVSYLYSETSNANQSVIEHYQTLVDYTRVFRNDENYNFIRPIVNDVCDIVEQILVKAGKTL